MNYVNYAHRGASSYAPENTLRAFYMGLEMGANGIETDIQLSADGVPMLFHDDTLERVTAETGLLSERTCEELKQIKVFCPDFPERADNLCTLEELCHHFGWRDLTFAMELKGPGCEKKALRMFEKYGMKDKVIITSFVFEYLEAAMKLDPTWRYGWLAEDFTPEQAEMWKNMGGYQLCPRATHISAEKVRNWNRQGLTVRAWGIRDEADMANAYACGTDGQTINFPDKLTAYLK